MTAAEEREIARARREHKELKQWRKLWGVKDATPHLGKMILDELSEAASAGYAREQAIEIGGAASRLARFSETGDLSILTEGLQQSEPEATILALAARLIQVEGIMDQVWALVDDFIDARIPATDFEKKIGAVTRLVKW